jgi:ribosomal protein S18 acetylase RimI-like enzyme
MRKLTELINENVDVKLQNLNSELLYLTEGLNQVGSLILIYNENKASIFSVEVLSDHRGKGYGKRLVEKAITRCKEKNCESIELNTELDNVVAHNLYTKLGFEVKGLKDGFNNYLLNI